jgi:hypothetical protein
VDAWLERLRLPDPALEVTRLVAEQPGADGEAPTHVGQVGTDDPVSLGAAHSVASPTTGVEEHVAASDRERAGRAVRRGALARQPSVERRLLLDHHGEAHERVRRSAVLGACAAKHAGPRRLEREARRPPRDHVHLSSEGRDPERVDDVAALEPELDRLADRQPDLVRQIDGPTGGGEVADPPPPLLAGHLDPEASLSRRGQEGGQRGEPERQESTQGDRREDDARSHDEVGRSPLALRSGSATGRVDRETDGGEPDDGGARAHPPEEVGDAFGPTAGWLEGRLRAAARGECQRRRAEPDSRRRVRACERRRRPGRRGTGMPQGGESARARRFCAIGHRQGTGRAWRARRIVVFSGIHLRVTALQGTSRQTCASNTTDPR